MQAELLARYLSKECTTQEYLEVERWLRLSEDHVEELKAYEQLWRDSANLVGFFLETVPTYKTNCLAETHPGR